MIYELVSVSWYDFNLILILFQSLETLDYFYLIQYIEKRAIFVNVYVFEICLTALTISMSFAIGWFLGTKNRSS